MDARYDEQLTETIEGKGETAHVTLRRFGGDWVIQGIVTGGLSWPKDADNCFPTKEAALASARNTVFHD